MAAQGVCPVLLQLVNLEQLNKSLRLSLRGVTPRRYSWGVMMNLGAGVISLPRYPLCLRARLNRRP